MVKKRNLMRPPKSKLSLTTHCCISRILIELFWWIMSTLRASCCWEYFRMHSIPTSQGTCNETVIKISVHSNSLMTKQNKQKQNNYVFSLNSMITVPQSVCWYCALLSVPLSLLSQTRTSCPLPARLPHPALIPALNSFVQSALIDVYLQKVLSVLSRFRVSCDICALVVFTFCHLWLPVCI